MKVWHIILAILIILVLLYASDRFFVSEEAESPVIQVGFVENDGQLTIIQSGNSLQFFLWIGGLQQKEYELSVMDKSSGVVFDSSNSRIRIGEIQGTRFIPSNGDLMVWSTHPKRIAENKEIRLIIKDLENHEEIKSNSFNVK